MKKKETKWLEKLSWEEFRDSGLLWFVNRTLHLFGRAICLEFEQDDAGNLTKIKSVFFARCRYRGFGVEQEVKGMITLTKFLKDNINLLEQDTKL